MAKLFQQIFLVFAVILAIVVATQAHPQQGFPQPKPCPPNQEWTTCGTACPNKCGQPQAKFCTYQCIIGCQCKPGYSLNSKGDCVLARDC
ncbi:hypothetical protein DOY81_009892 [Sarcophaga bullata]|nr:hypothetical protein DOY81_009892 [Sarcophaga bullata]